MSSNNLPPGCTTADIDRAAGADCQCPECDGTGKSMPTISNCCGVPMPHWPELDLCPYCHEHCEPDDCENCGGKGYIEPKTKEDLADEKADQERE